MNLSIIPYYFEVGNYHYFIINFLIEIFLGEGFIPIVKVEIRRLTSTQLKAVRNHLSKATYNFKYYKILNKLEIIITNWDSKTT